MWGQNKPSVCVVCYFVNFRHDVGHICVCDVAKHTPPLKQQTATSQLPAQDLPRLGCVLLQLGEQLGDGQPWLCCSWHEPPS